ncbi:MAG: gabD3 [Burkholderiaceae bacterium]|nr:gabD3 [Burkholderiaceae bacterium]
MYEQLALYIDGEFLTGNGRTEQQIINPATLEPLGLLPHASRADLDQALLSAHRAFSLWRDTPAVERSRILRRAAELLRERRRDIATSITLDEGKPLREAISEVQTSVEHLEWHAEEGRRIYGRIIPPRSLNVRQMVLREPVGVCAAFTPWNFPLGQAIRKVGAALGAGCTIIVKGAEECPSGIVAMARAFHDAGLPHGVLNVVWGVPSEISEYLLASPIVRQVSFTGSVPVGKHLASLAGAQMKRMTMELGGHAPAIVFDDADIDHTAAMLARYKLRNSGQICISPSRFFIHEKVYDQFVSRFVETMRTVKIGNGLEDGVEMGPLVHQRRVEWMQQLVDDARSRGATVLLGGKRLDLPGHFFAPTVLTEVPQQARILHEEPFGPIAPLIRFNDTDDVLREANSLPYGLASYVFTNSIATATKASNALEAGLVYVNQIAVVAETPFGGIKDSGIGSEGGAETFDCYLNTKYVMQG